MKKLNNILFNFFAVIVHILGTVFLEAACAAKIVWHFDWDAGSNNIVILFAAVIIGVHALLMNINIRNIGMNWPVCLALTVFDLVVTAIVLWFCLMPNPILYIYPKLVNFIDIILIQLVNAGVSALSFWGKKTGDGSLS